MSVGLRGFPTNATQTWETIPLTKNTVFPRLTITNPVSGTLSQTPIQFQGFASEPLDALTYDFSNAAGTFTNQQGDLTGVFYDTRLLAYTTNYFHSDNIYLASGANTITLHATDWAGNKTNVSFTVNFTPSTNPPVLSVVWPQAGTIVFTAPDPFGRHVSDPMATVMATVNGSATPGLVEGDGSVWVQNLSLQPGSNTVLLTAHTALGGLTATTFNVAEGGTNLGLTVDPINYYFYLGQSLITVSGAVNDLTTNSVYVNGVQGSSSDIDNNNTWVADYIPVSPYGMATVNVQVSNAVQVVSQTINYAQPVAVVMKSYTGHQTFVWDQTAYPGTPTSYDNINWSYDSGGVVNDSYFGPFNITSATNGTPYVDLVGPFDMPWEYQSLSANVPGRYTTYIGHTDTRVMLEPGGITQAGTTNSFLVFATVREFSKMSITNSFGYSYFDYIPRWPANGFNFYLPYGGDVGLPPEWLQINGQALFDTGVTNVTSPLYNDPGPSILSKWGATIVSVAAGQKPDVTPVATRVYNNWAYTFDVQAYSLQMQILDANGYDLTLQTNTVIVGQQMNMTCQIKFVNSFYTSHFYHATKLSNGLCRVLPFQITSWRQIQALHTVTNFATNGVGIKVYWVDGASNRIVQCFATVNGVMVSGQAVFNVLYPTVDWIGAMPGAVAVDTNYDDDFNPALPKGLTWLHLGNSLTSDESIVYGITFKATNMNLHGYAGEYNSLFCVQVITNVTSEYCRTNGQSLHLSGSGLDGIYPYDTLQRGLPKLRWIGNYP